MAFAEDLRFQQRASWRPRVRATDRDTRFPRLSCHAANVDDYYFSGTLLAIFLTRDRAASELRRHSNQEMKQRTDHVTINLRIGGCARVGDGTIFV